MNAFCKGDDGRQVTCLNTMNYYSIDQNSIGKNFEGEMKRERKSSKLEIKIDKPDTRQTSRPKALSNATRPEEFLTLSGLAIGDSEICCLTMMEGKNI